MSGETNRLLALASEISADPDRARARLAGLDRRAGFLRAARDGLARDRRPRRVVAGPPGRIQTDSSFGRARIQSIDVRASSARSSAARWRWSPGSRASTRTTTSRRSAAAAPTPPRRDRRGAQGRRLRDLHRRRRRLHDRSAHLPRRAQARAHLLRRDARAARASAPRCCRSARSSSPSATGCPCTCARASTTAREPGWFPRRKHGRGPRLRRRVRARTRPRSRSQGVPDSPGLAARIFVPLAEAGIVIDMIVQNVGARRPHRRHVHGGRGRRARAAAIAENSRRRASAPRRHAPARPRQGLGRRPRHAQPRRRRRPHVRSAGRRGHQHPDDLDVRDQDLGGRRQRADVERPCACCTRSSSTSPSPEPPPAAPPASAG